MDIIDKIFYICIGVFLIMFIAIVFAPETSSCNSYTLKQYIDNDVTAQCYPIVAQNFKDYVE